MYHLAQWSQDNGDGIFKCMFLNQYFCIYIKILLNSLPEGPMDNTSALAQVVA